MKVSLNWIKQFVDVQIGIDELVGKIEAQLGTVEAVTNLAGRYKGILVVKVVESVAHPNAERLHVCRIDDGGKTQGIERDSSGHIQIVCGAPNVHEGMLAVWLPPGSVVPDSIGTEPLVLEIREIRGQKSNGMLGSARELDFGDNHEGIVEINGEFKPGDELEKVFELDDFIIELENKMFTHRPDCFGQIGIAREVSGILSQQFTSPAWYKEPNLNQPDAAPQQLPLEVRNELPELVPRFIAVALSGITMKPGLSLLQSYLMRLGIRPINDVVDITNYMMLLTGQPMHAYDYDKVKALSGDGKACLVIRYPKPGEKLTLLGGKQVEPRTEAIMIATDKQAIGLGGIMGGAETEVDEHTSRIILECATFDMYSIRRTAMTLGLFTDAVTRFTKGQSPLQNDRVLYETIRLLAEHTGARLAGEIVDDNHVGERQWVHPPVPVTAEFINSRLGLQLSAHDMKQLLENVECRVELAGDKLTVSAPFWRTDIETREDVVEEVGRLYGYDKLPQILPPRDLTPTKHDPILSLKAAVRDSLSKSGANEVLTYSFVHGGLFEKVSQDKALAIQLSNALSPDLQYYRMSLTPSLLEKVNLNIKAGYGRFALFELGKSHLQNETDPAEPDVPKETNALSLVFANRQTGAGAAYYIARKYLINLLAEFGAKSVVQLEPLSGADLYNNPWIEQMVAPYEPTRSAVLRDHKGLIWGVVGEFKPTVRKALKLPVKCAGFELDPLLFMHYGKKTNYVALPRFPKVEQDISLKVPASLSYQQVFDFVWNNIMKTKPERTLAILGPIDIYQREDDTAHKQITLRLSIASYERTLTEEMVNTLLDKVAQEAKTQLQAERL